MERFSSLPRNASAGLDTSISSLNSVDQETSATSSANVDTQQSRWTSATTSLTASPLASRESSPSRSFAKQARTSRSSTATGARSRKNSLQDPSPSRSRPNLPTTTQSTTARQQLSSATTPTLPPPSASELVLRAPVPQKPSVASESSRDAPRWPVSPRLKSPPPILNKPAPSHSQAARKNEHEPPVISVQRATPSPNPPQTSEPSSQAASDNEADDAAHLAPGMRTPARGPSGGSSTLETVQEVSQPNTPGPDLDLAVEKLSRSTVSLDQSSISDGTVSKSTKSGANSESGSDSGSIKNTRQSSTVAPPPLLHSRQSSSTLKFGKGHTTGETSSKHITVEEEEVNSIPRVALGINPAGQGANGSLKTKPSSETIRPKKEKKKPSRKAPSVTSGTGEQQDFFATRPTTELRRSRSTRSMASTSRRSPRSRHCQGPHLEGVASPGPSLKLSRTPSITAHVTNLLTRGLRTASSKADIFEAKVASAVEEHNSSDSDETFVYDSNPPDVSDRPRRYHSRTPSATSMVSSDRNGMRSIHGVIDGSATNPAVKKNMKFVNTYNSNGTDSIAGDDDGKGTGGRSNAGSARGTARHHHLAGGRWGRNNGNNHLSLFDNESPFPNAARSKLSGSASRQSSNPPSPRMPPPGRNGVLNSKRQMAMAGGYDLDDTTTGADDEQTPLLPANGNRSLRSTRSRRYRDRGDLESHSFHQNPSFLNRFASCLVLTIMLLLVIMGAVGFIFATSQPLTDIKLVKIGNVLASEQELMMDITVKAHNPNIVVVQIDSADLEIFAKSPHAGTDSEWWRHPDGDEMGTLHNSESGEPVDDTAPNMRLGNVLELDSPLSFEGTFFQSGISTSSGELRLARPGNGTDSGSERWERILNDEFTLILKGVLKYTLPLSHKIRSVSISGKTTVKPNSANDPILRPNGTNSEIGIA